MTIARVSGNVVKCIWYDTESGRYSSAHFMAFLLKVVKNPSTSVASYGA
ncbi:MAG: hypothetical protein JST82_04245 [Bacteroidetes bacterium]|nr:hypothetical protein [Bacteroidota bacterium]